MNTKQELERLRRDLEQPRPKGYEPFDKYAYNVFAQDAARMMREFHAQANEAQRLYELALAKKQIAVEG